MPNRPIARVIDSGWLALIAAKIRLFKTAATLSSLRWSFAGGNGDSHFHNARLSASSHHGSHILMVGQPIPANRHFELFNLPVKRGQLPSQFGKRHCLTIQRKLPITMYVDCVGSLHFP